MDRLLDCQKTLRQCVVRGFFIEFCEFKTPAENRVVPIVRLILIIKCIKRNYRFINLRLEASHKPPQYKHKNQS